MATTKKGSNKKKASSKSMSLDEAAEANDATAALMAVSSDATSADTMNNRIFTCIVQAFDDQGLNHISDQQAKIVWVDIEDDVIVKLGDGVTECLAGKGIDVPELAGPFTNLKTANKITVVADLVTAIGKLA
jgi:hypothetical protein